MDVPLEDPKVGDMLDDLATTVLRTGSDVMVAPVPRMPSESGLAAILRYLMSPRADRREAPDIATRSAPSRRPSCSTSLTEQPGTRSWS
jgi:hypothetical protein